MHRTLAPILLVVLLAGCAGTPGATSPDPNPASVEGRTFLSTKVEGQVLVPGSRIRLGFENGSVSGSGGCNTFGGAYRIDDGRLATDQMFTTEMACDQPLMAQDTWVQELLNGAAVTLDGATLVLTRDGTTLTLQDREVADPDRPLEGTRWIVDGLVAGDAVSSVPEGVEATLRFVDGELELEAGCNRGGGPVEVADGIITFGAIGLTKMACDGPASMVEQHVLAVLSGRVGFEIEAGVLRLGGANGPGLLLRAA
jgi:heat shock protein HslJ